MSKIWTTEEKENMIELHKKGYDTYTIAKILNKSQFGITEKLREVEV